MFLIRQFFDIILSPAEKYSAGFLLYFKLISRAVQNNRSRIYPLCSILGWGNSVKCLKQMIKVTEITKSAFQRNIQNTSSTVKQ